MNYQSIWLALIGLLLTEVKAQWYLRCRLCHRAKSLEECTNYEECVEGQSCYVDEIITDALTIVYEAGCRAVDVCNGDGSMFGRRDEIISCSRCCESRDYCNQNLCGLRKQSTALMCNSCDGEEGRPAPPAYPDDCAYFRLCGTNEVCFASTIAVTGSEIAHYSTCRNLKVCQSLTSYIIATYNQSDTALTNRALGSLCDACCGDELCNKYACNTVKRRLLNLYEYGYLNLTTLKEQI